METGTLISRASERLGIGTLTPMQSEMARIKLPCRTLLLSPTGSGKTLAFAIALLRSIKSGSPDVKALVLAPTRELALQVYEVIRSLARPEFKTIALYGGHKFDTETKSLEAGADIVVATPGRLLDHIQRGSVNVHNVSVLVLDEYDKSLELGFLAEMRSIAGRLKNMKSLILTSATRLADMPDFLGTAPIK
ncbi:MAG: DEAD/DEAH box helicase, partial [Muribaculaceae bacterium]|nr:DEAD/DEAH box helicase [Muribaculaceae bacterium]